MGQWVNELVGISIGDHKATEKKKDKESEWVSEWVSELFIHPFILKDNDFRQKPSLATLSLL